MVDWIVGNSNTLYQLKRLFSVEWDEGPLRRAKWEDLRTRHSPAEHENSTKYVSQSGRPVPRPRIKSNTSRIHLTCIYSWINLFVHRKFNFGPSEYKKGSGTQQNQTLVHVNITYSCILHKSCSCFYLPELIPWFHSEPDGASPSSENKESKIQMDT
jgi:hypothetical protein